MFLWIHYTQFCNYPAFASKKLCLQMEMDRLCEKNFCLNLSKFDVGQTVTKDMANKRFPICLCLWPRCPVLCKISYFDVATFFLSLSFMDCTARFSSFMSVKRFVILFPSIKFVEPLLACNKDSWRGWLRLRNKWGGDQALI